MKQRYTSIAERINHLLEQEGLTVYEFCKQSNLLDNWKTFERALTKGDPDNVSPKIIKAVYDRYKDKISMLYIMYGDDTETVNKFMEKIQQLEKDRVVVSDILSKTYGEIKKAVQTAEQRIKGKKT